MADMRIENAIEILSDELDHIRHHLTEKGKHPEYYTELELIANAIEMGIEALRKEAHDSKWTPVKKRPPELYQNVLVHYYNPHCLEPHNYAVAYRQNGFDELIPGMNIWHVDSSPLELDGSDVTHWMTLPEPPKEVQDGN